MVFKLFIALVLLMNFSLSEEFSPAQYSYLVQKGEKIALKLCDKEKLATIQTKELNATLQQIDNLQPCIALNKPYKEALAYFLLSQNHHHNDNVSNLIHPIEVPPHSKCPVCGMFVSKYPKWSALMEIDDKKLYFDGVKDMMKYYIFDADFPYNRDNITTLHVTDFYTLQAINAKEAFYVMDSNVYGPMGNELIPFITQQSAQNFMHDHQGQRILKFNDITPKIIMRLDGIDY
jgi:copper chaperone NosL